MNAHQDIPDSSMLLLRQSIDAFTADKTDHQRTRELRWHAPGYDAALVREMADLGWLGILIPEEYGGLGLGFQEMAAVLVGLGRSLLGEPIVATAVLAGRLIVHGDNEGVKSQLLPALAEGRSLPALAWEEGAGALAPQSIETVADISAKGARISGIKRFVAGLDGATALLVSAQTPEGVALFLVDPAAPGLRVEREWRSDGTALSKVFFERAEASDLVASPSVALAALQRSLDEASVMASAEMFGILTETLARTIEYMKIRVQFGKPIASFQALQHRLVDLHILQEVCQSVLDDAVKNFDSTGLSATSRAVMASRVKARLSEGVLRVTREAVQLHGAIGYTEECDIGLYLRRALSLSAWLGNADAHRRRFIELKVKS